MSELAEFWMHTVTVETLQGTGASGDVYAAPAQVQGLLEQTTALVRAATGQEVVAGSKFYTDATNAALFPPDSRVTVNGRLTYVIQVSINEGDAMSLPSHAVVAIK